LIKVKGLLLQSCVFMWLFRVDNDYSTNPRPRETGWTCTWGECAFYVPLHDTWWVSPSVEAADVSCVQSSTDTVVAFFCCFEETGMCTKRKMLTSYFINC